MVCVSDFLCRAEQMGAQGRAQGDQSHVKEHQPIPPSPKPKAASACIHRHNPSQDKNGSVICTTQHYFVPRVLDVMK